MVYPNDHGSDHEILQSKFVIKTASPTKVPRLLFKEAPWTKICKYLQEQLYKVSAAPKDLYLFSYQIVNLLTDAIQKYIPVAKPSLYTKRSWTEDLSRLRGEYTQLKNLLWQKRRNEEPEFSQVEVQAWKAKGNYFKVMRTQKKKHWEEFLED